jgi:asparagine synthase (glutamine-hydrolysing)
MCGIAGVLTFDGRPVTEQEIAAMNLMLDHRGPDSSGVHVEGSLGLGHTRLAVMDPTPAGHQPMSHSDGRFWITYNGETYNFLEIRETLEGFGHTFRGDSDTEAVLAAFAEWGPDCQFRLNGEWAFCVWDAKERQLFLTRDRFGTKPLFYYNDGTRFAFASELKAFLALEWFDAAIDERALATAIANHQAFEGIERTIFRNVRRLLPGHCMTLGPSGIPKITRWWRTLDHLVETHRDPRRQAEQLRELMFDACTLRMRSDIPMGTSVSGGLDSSAVHCVMAHLNAGGTSRPRQAASWDRAVICKLEGWDDENFSVAEDVVRHAGTKAIVLPMRAEDALDSLDDLIFHFEQVGPVPVGQWLLYRSLREAGVLVTMEGHGADEAFAGFREGPKIAYLDTLQKLHGYVDAMKAIGVKSPNEVPDQSLIEVTSKLPRETVDLRVGSYPGARFLTTEPYGLDFPIWEQDRDELASFDALTRILYLQFHCSRSPWILHDFETACMAHGVESRAPFLDWRIICYGFSLPAEAKIRDGQSKYPIRAALGSLMPDSVNARRTKVGFPLPLYSWFEKALKPYILDHTAGPDFLQCGVWDGPALRQQVEATYADGGFGRMRALWSFVQADRLRASFRDYRRTAALAADAVPQAAGA